MKFAGESRLLLFLGVDQPAAQIARCFLGEFARRAVAGCAGSPST